jgi:YD repeat-containing protein
MNRRLLLLLTCAGAWPAAAETTAPELKPPSPDTEVWSPLRPYPDTRPDIPWDKLLEGYTERKQISKEGRQSEVVASHVKRSYRDGRVTKIEQIESGKIAATTDYGYDAKGRLVKSFERHEPSGSIGGYTMAYEYRYDDAGHLDHMTKNEVDGGKDLGKAETTFAYDAAGRLLTRTDGVGAQAGVTHFIRSKTGVLLGLTIDQVDGKKNLMYQGREDGHGRLARLLSQPDVEEVVGYDAAGHETSRITTRGKEKVTLTMTVDATGHLLELRGETQAPDHTGNEHRAAKYDAQGHMISLVVSSSRTQAGHHFNQVSEIVFSWDDAGRLVAEKEKFGGGDGQHGFNLDAETTYKYDGKGRLIQIVAHAIGYPPLDRTTTTTYSY